MNILVVDDEKEIADLVELYLKNENFHVFKFYNGCDALRCVETKDIDLAVLDIMLPDIDGLKICSKIRETKIFPIIMLTAKETEIDKIHHCYLDNQLLSLTPTEFSILWLLCSNKGKVVSVDQIFHDLWGEKYYTNSSSSIMVHIRHLREKMNDSAENPRYIQTVWGVGYKIE